MQVYLGHYYCKSSFCLQNSKQHSSYRIGRPHSREKKQKMEGGWGEERKDIRCTDSLGDKEMEMEMEKGIRNDKMSLKKKDQVK